MGFLLANSKADTDTDWVFCICIGALSTKSKEKYRYRLGNLYLYRCSGRREQRKLPIQTGYFMFASVFFVPRARKNTDTDWVICICIGVLSAESKENYRYRLGIFAKRQEHVWLQIKAFDHNSFGIDRVSAFRWIGRGDSMKNQEIPPDFLKAAQQNRSYSLA